MVSEAGALFRGLDWLFKTQKNDGGWSEFGEEGYSILGTTDHVAFTLLPILGFHSTVLTKALLYIEQQYVKRSINDIGYWPRATLRGTPDTGGALLCSYTLLTAHNMGRELLIISKRDLLETARYSIEHEVSMAETGQANIWALHMCALLLRLGYFDSTLIERTKNISLRIIEEKFLGSSNVDLASYAHIVLALLHFSDKSFDKIIGRAVYELSSFGRPNAIGVYWPHIDNRPGGSFEITRWVLWALIEAVTKGTVEKEPYLKNIQEGLSWIINQQESSGYWSREQGTTFEPNYIGYALLVLWKWIEFNSILQKDVLIVITDTLSNANVPVFEHEKLKGENQYLMSERKLLEEKSKKLRWILYIATIALVALAIITLHISRLDVALWQFAKQYGYEIGIIGGVLAVILAGWQVIKSLIRRRKNV